MAGFLGTMAGKADWKEWRNAPETFRVGEQVHFLLPLTFDGQTATYCFSFLLEKGRWYFQHLEAITLRMDRLGSLPASTFPDLPEKDKAWVPVVPPSRAFILYLCWEQANLRGNEVVLEQLDDTTALVRMRPLYLQLYERSAHLKLQIQPDAYRRLFESRWRDRTSAAGWNLDITCQAGDCIFRFARLPGPN